MTNLEQLERLVADLGVLNSGLVLVVGDADSSKLLLLRQVGLRLGVEPVNLGVELGRRLATTLSKDRGFEVSEILRSLTNAQSANSPVLLNRLEVLFERSLQVNPVELLKRLARGRCVVAVWPGEFHAGRLIYAPIHHPEHFDHSADGVVVFEL